MYEHMIIHIASLMCFFGSVVAMSIMVLGIIDDIKDSIINKRNKNKE